MEQVPNEILTQADACFDKYDFNRNNMIEYSELKELMTDVAKEIGIPSPSDEDVSTIMEDTDVNRDKRISREEFITLFKIIYTMKNIKNE